MCQSNHTHVGWPFEQLNLKLESTEETTGRILNADSDCQYERQSDAENAALAYLRRNVRACEGLALDLTTVVTLMVSREES